MKECAGPENGTCELLNASRASLRTALTRPAANKKITRLMFIKHYAPNRCLCIKVANSIDHWVEDCRDVTKAGGGGICTKNGSYCEKEKKVREGGQGRCERRSEAFVKIIFFFFFFFWGGGGGRVGGGSGWM